MISAQADSTWASAPSGNWSHVEMKEEGGGLSPVRNQEKQD